MLQVLHIPAREHDAFVRFARAGDAEVPFNLAAWDPRQASWRAGQLPGTAPVEHSGRSETLLQYELTANEAYAQFPLSDGRTLFHIKSEGAVSGAIEGSMRLNISQIILPKPQSFSYTQALPMHIAAKFQIESGADRLEGSYSGTYTPMMDAHGNGQGQVQATGVIFHTTVGLAEFLFSHVFVQDTVKIVEANGVGAGGTMRLQPPR